MGYPEGNRKRTWQLRAARRSGDGHDQQNEVSQCDCAHGPCEADAAEQAAEDGHGQEEKIGLG